MMTMKLSTSLLPLLVAIGTAAAFTPPQPNTVSTGIQSTVLPTPIPLLQPELTEDDLYITPPVRNPPVPGSIMKMLPPNTFEIDTPTSLFYFFVDLVAVVTTMGFLDVVVTSENYHNLPIWGQAACVMPLQVLTGFAMW
jgi:hypothetical protein